jgi:hypothetical protein
MQSPDEGSAFRMYNNQTGCKLSVLQLLSVKAQLAITSNTASRVGNMRQVDFLIILHEVPPQSKTIQRIKCTYAFSSAIIS